MVQHYTGDKFDSGAGVAVNFEEDTIIYKLDNLFEEDGEFLKDNWKITPSAPMKVCSKHFTSHAGIIIICMQAIWREARYYDGSSSFACRLSLNWCGSENELKPLVQKITLEGSMDSKFLLLKYPPPRHAGIYTVFPFSMLACPCCVTLSLQYSTFHQKY